MEKEKRSGFRSGFRTEMALVRTWMKVLHFSMAFSSIDHGILLFKLQRLGVEDAVSYSLQSFLNRQSQKEEISLMAPCGRI